MPENKGEFSAWLVGYMRKYLASPAAVASVLGKSEKTVREWLEDRGPDNPKLYKDYLMGRYTLAVIRAGRLMAKRESSEDARTYADRLIELLDAAEQQEGLSE